ncbi:hypothetical protein [Streptomyces collinus]|uniref:hypothetical protein n=1 Tax=Streptomyces collinus TaxID=42684 RepID=UPI003EBC577B
MGTLVYPEAHDRAAALLHLLVRVPALESRNELFGAAVAGAYLTASGLTVTVQPPRGPHVPYSKTMDALLIEPTPHP